MTSVLIVEDDSASGEILLRLLEHSNFKVDLAIDAQEALEYLEQNDYALAVIDLALPGMDGWQLLSEIQTNPSTASLKAVALTAYYDPQIANEARQAGFLQCYPKPATSKLVQELVGFMN